MLTKLLAFLACAWCHVIIKPLRDPRPAGLSRRCLKGCNRLVPQQVQERTRGPQSGFFSTPTRAPVLAEELDNKMSQHSSMQGHPHSPQPSSKPGSKSGSKSGLKSWAKTCGQGLAALKASAYLCFSGDGRPFSTTLHAFAVATGMFYGAKPRIVVGQVCLTRSSTRR